MYDAPTHSYDAKRRKFTGKERAAETGLDYFGARYYSNGLGRWISADWSATPIPVPYADLTDPQMLNLYGYVRGLPTTKADLDGHGFLTKFKNWLNDGGWNEDKEAQQERQRRFHQRAEDARKSLSGMKNFTINGKTPAEFARGATDQQAIAGLNAATNFVFAEAQKNFFCGPGVSCGIAFPIGALGALDADAVALSKQLASQAQVGELEAGDGRIIFGGAGANKPLTEASRLVGEYGGRAADWVKISSSNFKAADGVSFETHAYKNVVTGQIVEFKTKFQ